MCYGIVLVEGRVCWGLLTCTSTRFGMNQMLCGVESWVFSHACARWEGRQVGVMPNKTKAEKLHCVEGKGY